MRLLEWIFVIFTTSIFMFIFFLKGSTGEKDLDAIAAAEAAYIYGSIAILGAVICMKFDEYMDRKNETSKLQSGK